MANAVRTGNVTALTALLSYHLVPGVTLSSADLLSRNGQQLQTALNVPLTIRATDATNVRLIGVGSEALVTQQKDLVACNGVLHVIDTLLIPVALGGGARGGASGAQAQAQAPAAAVQQQQAGVAGA